MFKFSLNLGFLPLKIWRNLKQFQNPARVFDKSLKTPAQAFYKQSKTPLNLAFFKVLKEQKGRTWSF